MHGKIKEVMDQMVAHIESGVVPWRKSWSATAPKIPTNPVTERRYRGSNTLLLWAASIEHGFTSHHWAGFHQWRQLGATVKKGEKASFITKAGTYERDGKDGEKEKGFFARTYWVFNADQVEGWEAPHLKRELRNAEERVDDVDQFILGTRARILQHPDHAPVYRVDQDMVQTPPFEMFDNGACYYATMFHELTHWTGHKSRLDRMEEACRSMRGRAVEELIAELGATILCSQFDLEQPDYAGGASYIAQWMQEIPKDERSSALFEAASKASAAVDYMASLQSCTQKQELEAA
jgi:antirestriction protein ArdC